ncbi:hypothetical protein [Facilibium subflavum]|uniref:hypothetical protein n=1 Tax=Facilibium subflavum TaxID=2219058 RepID=UPI000E6577F8|nr:hypothetical protein [Facilibium subflavum]
MPMNIEEVKDILAENGLNAAKDNYPEMEEMLTAVFIKYMQEKFNDRASLENNTSGRLADINAVYDICSNCSSNPINFKQGVSNYIETKMKFGVFGKRGSKLASMLNNFLTSKEYDELTRVTITKLTNRNLCLSNDLNKTQEDLIRVSQLLDESTQQLKNSTVHLDNSTKEHENQGNQYKNLLNSTNEIKQEVRKNEETTNKLYDDLISLKKTNEELRNENEDLKARLTVYDNVKLDELGSYPSSYSNSPFEARVNSFDKNTNLTQEIKNT